MIGLTITLLGEDDVLRMLSQAQGVELKNRMRRGTRAGAQVLVTPIRREIQTAGLILTGHMLQGVSVRGNRSSIGANVGPRAWYRHFVIRGTKRGIPPHPVVDRAVDSNFRQVVLRTADVVLRGRR